MNGLDRRPAAPPRLRPLSEGEMTGVMVAKALADQGRYDRALEILSAALAATPDLIEARLALADIHVRRHEWARAEEAFRALLALAPAHAQARLGMGLLHARAGRHEAAVADLRESVRVNDRQPLAHLALARACLALGRNDEAIAACRAALALDATLAPAHVQIGDARRAQGLYDDALAAYQEAIRISPRLAAAHLRLGDAQALRGRPEAAIPAYEAALMANPLLLDAHRRIGRAHRALGRPAEAARHFEAELRLAPGRALVAPAGADAADGDAATTGAETTRRIEAAILCDLGEAWAAAGEEAKAMRSFLEALDRDPGLLPAEAPEGTARALVIVPRASATIPSPDEPPALTILRDRRAPRGDGGPAWYPPPLERRRARVALGERAILVLEARA